MEEIKCKAHDRSDTYIIYKIKSYRRVLDVEFETFHDLMQLIEQGADYEIIYEVLIA